MKLLEEKRDLFSVDRNKYVLAHCISVDCAMGEGIAKTFTIKHKALKDYCMMFSLRNKMNVVGKAYRYKDKNGVVYNLFTKRYYWMNVKRGMKDNEYYNNLYHCLVDMKRQMINNNENYLAIPLIGCGLDRCEWVKVKNIIEKVFSGTDIEILVCRL